MNANLQIANVKIVYADLSYKITGALFTVHNELGRYCNEKQYADALENLFKKLKVSYEREKTIPESFQLEKSGRNKVDFIIEDKVLLELKAKRLVSKEDYYQVRRYLSALNKKLGIIVNFRDKFIKPKRILNSGSAE
ncbi:MAG: GxxExxY protein [Candidatus Doudnabacteria bacterium]|nr:GxxExxY protein [Candidatus Doudnabacteria bacterium]